MASLLTDEFVRENGLPADPEGQRELIARWHKTKTAAYKARVHAGQVPGRPGVARIVDEALAAGWILAVASTSAEESVRATLEHAVGDGEGGPLQLCWPATSCRPRSPTPASTCWRWSAPGPTRTRRVVIEDSRNGLLAAVAAGLRCVVTVSSYTGAEDFSEAVLVVSSLGDPGEPAQVLANRSPAEPGPYITLDDLQACLRVPAPREVT